MRIKWICIGLVAVLSLAVGAGAEENGEADTDSAMMEEMRDLYGDEAFVTIATGSRKPIFKAPAVASVITADEIEALGARSLDEVLETVAGLHVAPSTQGRLDSIYSIRGIHTKVNPHILVLINGIPFPHFTGGRPFQFRLPVAAISRVEVIRGPGSAIYGADAFAGVINVVTKDAEEMRGTGVGGRAGSFDTYDLWLQHGRTLGGWDVGFSLEWQKSEGDRGRRIDSDLQTRLDQIGTSASLAPGPLNTQYNVLDTHLDIKRGNWRLRHWYWRQEDAGLGAGSSLALDPVGEEDLAQHLLEFAYRTTGFAPDWDLSANLNYLYRESDSQFVLLPPGTRAPIGIDGNLDFDSTNFISFPQGIIGNPSGKEKGGGLDLVALYAGITSHRWRVGAGVKTQKLSITSETKNFGPGVISGTEEVVDGALVDVADTRFVFLPDESRTAWYLSVQDEWQIAPSLEATLGVRYDHYSDFGETVNPRLALVWAARHNLTTKVLYGRAFRAPSFLELSSINNPVALGNKELGPEKVDTVEVSIDYRPTFDLQTTTSLFAYKAKDLIEFVPGSVGTNNTAQNARDQEGYGFELEMNWNVLETLRLRGNYAWQRSRDADTHKRIPDAPGQQLYIAADWRFLPKWILYPQFVWVGDRRRAEGDTRSKIKDYSLVHLALRRKEIFRHMDLALIVRNLMDENVREPGSSVIPNDYSMEGRSFIGEISYRF